jgi:G6PDH family F420-dependent oxidoreductase
MEISKVGVVGCGLMGHGIAQICAQAGWDVVVRELSEEKLDAGMGKIEKQLARAVEKGKAEQGDADAVRGRIQPTLDYSDLADCDLVIEAITEDLDLKLEMWREVDGIVKDGAVLATNTSSLPVIAQAAATTAAMFEGRFFLGVGTGENLNEHIFGDPWPEYEVRAEMLVEAVELMRDLWRGELMSHHGEHYLVENARLYTVPETPPPVLVAASGTRSAELAGEIGDGFIGTSPERELLQAFIGAGGDGKPTYGQVTVCWGEDEAAARRLTKEIWPTAGVPGDLSTELPLPRHFEQVSELVTEEMLAEKIACGPDPERHIAAIRPYIDAGYDNVYIHQVGPDQAGFLRFYRDRILPELS